MLLDLRCGREVTVQAMTLGAGAALGRLRARARMVKDGLLE